MTKRYRKGCKATSHLSALSKETTLSGSAFLRGIAAIFFLYIVELQTIPTVHEYQAECVSCQGKQLCHFYICIPSQWDQLLKMVSLIYFVVSEINILIKFR